jgi:sugar transport system substrate-binding protein
MNLAQNLLLAVATISIALIRSCSIHGDAPDSDGVTIASIVFQDDQFMMDLQRGVREVAQDAGAVVLETNVSGSQSREAAAIRSYADQGVDAIVIAPLSSRRSGPVLRRAKRNGVVVVVLNERLDDGDVANATVWSRNSELGHSVGEDAAAFIRDRLGGTARIAIIGFSGQMPAQSKSRTEAFKKAAGRGNRIEIAAALDAWMPEPAHSKTLEMLAEHPDVNVIFAANEGATLGALEAVRSAGRAGEVFVFGIDITPMIVEALLAEDDVLQGVAGQLAREMGRLGAKTALQILKGEAVASDTALAVLPLSRREPKIVEAHRRRSLQ